MLNVPNICKYMYTYIFFFFLRGSQDYLRPRRVPLQKCGDRPGQKKSPRYFYYVYFATVVQPQTGRIFIERERHAINLITGM